MFISQTGLTYFDKWPITCETKILNLFKCGSGICNRFDQRLFLLAFVPFTSQRASGTRVGKTYKCMNIDLHIIINLGEETLVSAINNCKTLLDSLSNTKKVITWSERMTNLQEDWTKARSTIFDCIISTEHLPSKKCSFCLEGDACVRCHQCGLSFTLCEVCDERIHSCSAFHDRELWNGKYFEPASPMEKLDKLTCTKVQSGTVYTV